MNRKQSGIVVGLDQKLEWLLPWWWASYSKHNDFPVVFIDFGMSPIGRSFCLERGELLKVEISPRMIQSKSQIPKERAEKWQRIYGETLWNSRLSWFQKPFALLKTPFKSTIWLDLDCEVLIHLKALFQYGNSEIPVALARETDAAILQEKKQGQLLEGEILYNSGVIVYQKGTPLIEKWAQAALQSNGEFWGDQQLLSRLIFQHCYKIHELSPNYNWRMSQGFNIHAAIIHWAGSWGKQYIRQFGGLGHELEKLPKIELFRNESDLD